MNRMKVNIWSDIRCPFCYVGKKKFEKALEKFTNNKDIEVEWHSFQLDPSLETQPNVDPLEFFSKRKNISLDRARMMHEHAHNAGKEAGIDFNFENQKIANSFKGHLLIQLAKTKGKSSEMEEALFRAQFINSKNIDNEADLLEIGKSVGFSEEQIKMALSSDELAYKANQDMQMAQSLGISSVPFFVFNDKYGVSGAQQPETFLEILNKAWSEYCEGDKGLKIIQGDSCDANGNCN